MALLTDNFPADFLSELFHLWYRNGVKYAVLRDYELLPEKLIGGDLDIVIPSEQTSLAIRILYENVQKHMLRLLTKVDYGHAFLHMFYGFQNNEVKHIRIDINNDQEWYGLLLLSAKEIISRRRLHNGVWVADFADDAFLCWIGPLIASGKVKRQRLQKIVSSIQEDRATFERVLCKSLGLRFGKRVIDLLKNNIIETEKLLFLIRLNILFQNIVHSPCRTVIRFLHFVYDALYRKVFPPGLFVCIVGPDGSGKSSIIDNIKKPLFETFTSKLSTLKHLRPGLLPSLANLFRKHSETAKPPVFNPHASKPSGYIFSILRLIYYSIDYVWGYWIEVKPRLIRNSIVIFDRYYYDFVVDPTRCRVKLPKQILKTMLFFIPTPDLTIYLDNEPEELYRRKQELPVEELKRQVKSWREFIPQLPNVRIVTTNKPLEDVVNEVTKIVLERRAEMTRKMLKIDPGESFYLWKSNLAGSYIALPSKKNCRWIVPTNPILAKKSWDLYLPYSFTGRAFKSVMKYLSAWGLLKLFKFNKLNLELSDESEGLRKCIADVFECDDFVLALSTGTPGPFRKITAIVIASDGRVLGFAKIGETPLAIERIKNEARVLKLLVNSYQLSGGREQVAGIRYPECMYEGEVGKAYVMIQTPPPFVGKSGDSKFNEDYAEVLNILIKNTIAKKKFMESEFYKNLKQGIETYPLSYRDILTKGLQYLEQSVGDKEITFALSHGDFAPWNMIWEGKEVFLFDWEFAEFEVPFGHDIVDFLFNTEFFIKRRKGEDILKIIVKKTADISKHYHSIFGKDKLLPVETLCLSYFLQKATEQDRYYLLNPRAVERRKMIKLLLAVI